MSQEAIITIPKRVTELGNATTEVDGRGPIRESTELSTGEQILWLRTVADLQSSQPTREEGEKPARGAFNSATESAGNQVARGAFNSATESVAGNRVARGGQEARLPRRAVLLTGAQSRPPGRADSALRPAPSRPSGRARAMR